MSDSADPQQPEPKRRRRSGWDVQAPASASTTEVDEEFLKQQAQQAMVAQQLAMQKAQQLLAQQALQRTLGGIAINLPKPGCRIYVG
jgi:predicted house-cleaning NTP pyrophosphatase (Maf/HAM1 superfamily)